MVDRDFVKYWQSLGKDLKATKDRVRNLIGHSHWLTDGTYKEIILRNTIERHLPENLKICTGFVCSEECISTQIDLLIIDKSAFTLFKEGDLAIVTQSAVRAIIEVKTTLDRPSDIEESLTKLAKNGNLSEQRSAPGPFWTGLFVFESTEDRTEDKQKQLLQALRKANLVAHHPINCVAYGPNTFIRFWQNHRKVKGQCWVSYEFSNLAAGYFIGNIIAELTPGLGHEDGSALFPIEGTKETKRKFYIKAGGKEIEVKRFRS